ncbi:MAG TPA: elongation factor P [Planctomycetes bacterium]|nr:elongation factor P [Planctomycetota bacterium]
MAKMRAPEIKTGMALEIDGDLFLVVEREHVTPGKGQALYHFLLRSLKTGSQKPLRMGSNDTAEVAYLERKKCQYLYRDAHGYVFMDEQSYEQFPLHENLVGEQMGFIAENSSADVTFHNETPVSVDLPASVTLEVIEAEEAVRGNTATNVTKNAKVETGLEVKVPMHIRVGDKIKISTVDKSFQGRVKD